MIVISSLSLILSVSLCLCLSLSLSVSLSLFLSLSLSLCRSLSFFLSLSLSLFFFLSPFISPSLYFFRILSLPLSFLIPLSLPVSTYLSFPFCLALLLILLLSHCLPLFLSFLPTIKKSIPPRLTFSSLSFPFPNYFLFIFFLSCLQLFSYVWSISLGVTWQLLKSDVAATLTGVCNKILHDRSVTPDILKLRREGKKFVASYQILCYDQQST